VSSSTTKIVVHAHKELKISTASFKSASLSVTAGSPVFNTDLESVTLEFGQELPLGEGELHVEFEGVLNDDLVTTSFRLPVLIMIAGRILSFKIRCGRTR